MATTDSAAKIKRGDAYEFPIKLTYPDGPLDISDVDTAEFVMGSLRKLYPAEVRYDGDFAAFMFPLTQGETFAFEPGVYELDIRVKMTDSSVIGLESPRYIEICRSISEEIL